MFGSFSFVVLRRCLYAMVWSLASLDHTEQYCHYSLSHDMQSSHNNNDIHCLFHRLLILCSSIQHYVSPSPVKTVFIVCFCNYFVAFYFLSDQTIIYTLCVVMSSMLLYNQNTWMYNFHFNWTFFIILLSYTKSHNHSLNYNYTYYSNRYTSSTSVLV